VQLLPCVHDISTVTRSLTAVLHATVTCANLPFTRLWRDVFNGVYAEWFDSSRSMLKGPVCGEYTVPTFTYRITGGAFSSGPRPPRLLYTSEADEKSMLTAVPMHGARGDGGSDGGGGARRR